MTGDDHSTGGAFPGGEFDYRGLFDAMGDAIHVIDRDLRILVFNAGFEALCDSVGMDRDIVGKTVFEAFPFLPDRVRDEYKRVFDEDAVVITEEQNTVGTRTVWTETRKIPIVEDGVVTRIVTILRDVTERKLAADALRASEERYRAVVDDQTELICRFGEDGVLSFVNDAYCMYFERSRESLVGFTFMPLIPEGDREYVMANFNTLSPECPVVAHEHRVIMPSGQIRWHRWTNTAIYDGQDDLIEYQGVGTDITERKLSEFALQRSEKQYRELVNNALIGVFKTTLSGDILFVNDAVIRINEYDSAEAMMAERVQSRYKDPEKRAELLAALKTEGRIDGLEMDLITGKGNTKTILLSCVIDGDVLSGTMVDIDELKRAQVELERSETRFRSLIEQTTDAVFCYEYDRPIRTDLPVEEQALLLCDGVLVECNDVCARSYGYAKADDAIGRTLTALYGVSAGDLGELFREFVSNGYRTVDGENIETQPDGTERWFSNNAHGVIEDGALVRVWGTYRDITERKEAEQALRESEARFRSFTENAPDFVMQISQDGVIQFISRTVEGLRREDVEGTRVSSWIPAECMPAFGQALSLVFETALPQVVEHPTLGDTDEVLWYSSHMGPVGELGNVTSAIVVSRDITDRKEARVELERSNAELARANEQLEKLHRDKDEFVAMVSHELRTPLVTGLGYMELLLEGDLGAISQEADKGMSVALRNLRRLSELIDDILSYHSLIKSDLKLSPSVMPFDAAVLCRDAASEFIVRCGREPNSVKVDVPDAPLAALGDDEMIRRVLDNLLDNAEKHGGSDSVVTVSARESGGSVEIAVEDDGVGFPAAMSGEIFDPFVQLGEGTEGTGLGLAIVRGILACHGTSPELRAGEGEGVRISFALRAADGVVPSVEASELASAPKAGGGKVLVVDDDADTLGFMSLVLSKAGHFVSTAESGEDALEMISGEVPDIAIVDMTLPGLDGAEVCRIIKEDPATAGIAVAIFTARAEDSTRRRAEAAGSDGYIIKPIVLDDLLTTVDRLIRGRR